MSDPLPRKPAPKVPPVEPVQPAPPRGGEPEPELVEAGRRGVRKAVALEYRHGKQRAPVVTASGKGELAEQIIALAREHGIFVEPDPDLVELLAHIDLGTTIPPQLYYVVAEILAFVYKLNRDAGS
ncbi:MAG TPA: EscU/YscU/HrcU family type III secretion system export apparatus switch protein, partial [Chloroflexota bacterium]